MTILNRLRSAESGSRELDVAIRTYEVGATAEWQDYKQDYAFHRDGSWVSIEPIEPASTSIDAALALVKRMLPGLHHHTLYSAYLSGMGTSVPNRFSMVCHKRNIQVAENGATPPLAILTALFTALEAKDIAP